MWLRLCFCIHVWNLLKWIKVLARQFHTQQIRETKPLPPIAYICYLVNCMLISSLQLATFFWLPPVSSSCLQPHLQNIRYILTFNKTYHLELPRSWDPGSMLQTVSELMAQLEWDFGVNFFDKVWVRELCGKGIWWPEMRTVVALMAVPKYLGSCLLSTWYDCSSPFRLKLILTMWLNLA